MRNEDMLGGVAVAVFIAMLAIFVIISVSGS